MINFKATFEGMDAPITKTIFEYKTKDDTKHKVIFVSGENSGDDKFELYTNGVKSSEYKTSLINESAFSVNRLVAIFNILKVKEAQNKIEKIKNNRQ